MRAQWFAAMALAIGSLVATAPNAAAQGASTSSDDDLEVPATAPEAPGSAPKTLPPAAPPPPGPGPPAAPPADPADTARAIAELRARLEALEARSGAEPSHPVVRDDATTTPLPTTSFDVSPWSRTWARGFVLGGYVQAQYQHSQASQDQLGAGGETLNQDRFLVRRARLRFDRGWEYAAATVEIDGNNQNGFAFGLRRAEASLLARAPERSAPPLAALTGGLTGIPVGYELYEPNRTRLFLERTTGSRAFFPGDADFGASIGGALGFFRYAVGAFDGTPVPDSAPNAIGFDPTAQKDLVARFGVETQPAPDLGVSGGVSFVGGDGFHAGTAATKSTLEWQDTNQNGVVDTGEVIGVPGQAATPSKLFPHWALGADLEVRLRTPIGRAMVYGEAYVASNFDRGLFVADPVETGVNLREVSWYVAYVQEIARYGVVGVRVDAYNPNGDARRQLAGALLPLDQTITTYSPLVGLVLPDRARLMFEYDHVVNRQGLSASGVPVAVPEDQWALRLQVEM